MRGGFLNYVCAYCRARAGYPCKTPKGRQTFPHTIRLAAPYREPWRSDRDGTMLRARAYKAVADGDERLQMLGFLELFHPEIPYRERERMVKEVQHDK